MKSLVIIFLCALFSLQVEYSYSEQIKSKQSTDTTKRNSKDTLNHSPFLGNQIKTEIAQVSTSQKNKETDKEVSTTETTDNSGSLGNTLLIIGTWVLAIIAFWQASISKNTAKKQYNLARDNARIELRAYVSAHPNNGSGFFASVVGNSITIQGLILQNNGRTPAHNFRASSAINISKPSEIVFTESPFTPLNVGSLGSDCSFPMPRIEFIDVDSAIIEGLREQTYCLYVWGCLFYDDVFGIEHYTKWRYLVQWQGDNFGGIGMIAEGNDAN